MTIYIVQCINSAMTELFIGEYYLAKASGGSIFGSQYFQIEPLPTEILLGAGNITWAVEAVACLTTLAAEKLENQEALGFFISHRFDFVRSSAALARAKQMRKSRAEFTGKGKTNAHSES